MSKESKLIKNTAIIAIGNIMTKCISFFMLPLYTSLLSTTQFGTVDLISTYSALLLIIITLQFEQGVFRYLVEVRDNKGLQKKYITTAVVTVFLMAVLFCVSIGVVLTIFNYKYTCYFLVIVFFGSIYTLLLQVPRGLGNNTIYAVSSFISGALHVVLNVFFIAILKMGVEGMLIGTIISQIVASMYIVIAIRLVAFIDYSTFDKEILRELLKYSLPLVPYTLCWWVINASDRTIIQKFMGTSANGLYAVAYKFPSLFSMVSNIFQLAWTESAAENANSMDRDEYYNQIMNKSIRFYSSCNMGIIAILPFVFSFLIKNQFAETYYYIPILMTAALFHSIAGLYGSIYFAFKATKKVAITTFIAAAVNIVINLLFINEIGLYAAASSSLLAYLVIILIRVIDLNSMVNITIKKSYLLSELIVYGGIFYGYYCGGVFLKALVLIVVVIYALWQNWDIVKPLVRMVLKKINTR